MKSHAYYLAVARDGDMAWHVYAFYFQQEEEARRIERLDRFYGSY